MKKSLKKTLASIMAVASLLVGVPSINANADTTVSHENGISIAPCTTNYWGYSTTRSKSNNTKAYLHVSSGPCSPAVKILGGNSQDTHGNMNCTLNSSGNSVSYLVVSVGGVLYINNNVRNNYNFATLAFQSSSSYIGGYINIDWSADTNGNN